MLPKKLGLASIFRGTSNEQFGSFDSGCKEINTKNTMFSFLYLETQLVLNGYDYTDTKDMTQFYYDNKHLYRKENSY